MMKSKYNVGDKVLVKGGLCLGERYGEVLFISNMADFCDKIVTIIEVCEASDGSGQFRYRISNCDYWWSDEMFVRKIDESEDNLKKQIKEVFRKDKQGEIIAESFPSSNSYRMLIPYLNSNHVESVFLSPNEIKLTFINGNIITFDRKSIEGSINFEPENDCNLFGGNNMTMPEIVDYTYNPETGETYIKWSDKWETKVVAENPETADQYFGFVTAYAKKAAGNTSHITGLFEKWAIKRPERELKKQIINNTKLLEEKRIAENRKAKREQYLIHKEALRLKREYEAKKLANEKYGVPMDEDK